MQHDLECNNGRGQNIFVRRAATPSDDNDDYIELLQNHEKNCIQKKSCHQSKKHSKTIVENDQITGRKRRILKNGMIRNSLLLISVRFFFTYDLNSKYFSCRI